MGHNATMAKKKTDRHKPAKMIRVRGPLAVQVEILANRNSTDATEEVNRAVREMLEREGLWPPSRKEPS